jgi:hypothetical protein
LLFLRYHPTTSRNTLNQTIEGTKEDSGETMQDFEEQREGFEEEIDQSGEPMERSGERIQGSEEKLKDRPGQCACCSNSFNPKR